MKCREEETMEELFIVIERVAAPTRKEDMINHSSSKSTITISTCVSIVPNNSPIRRNFSTDGTSGAAGVENIISSTTTASATILGSRSKEKNEKIN